MWQKQMMEYEIKVDNTIENDDETDKIHESNDRDRHKMLLLNVI